MSRPSAERGERLGESERDVMRRDQHDRLLYSTAECNKVRLRYFDPPDEAWVAAHLRYGGRGPALSALAAAYVDDIVLH